MCFCCQSDRDCRRVERPRTGVDAVTAVYAPAAALSRHCGCSRADCLARFTSTGYITCASWVPPRPQTVTMLSAAHTAGNGIASSAQSQPALPGASASLAAGTERGSGVALLGTNQFTSTPESPLITVTTLNLILSLLFQLPLVMNSSSTSILNKLLLLLLLLLLL